MSVAAISPLKSSLLAGFLLLQVSISFSFDGVRKFSEGFSGRFERRVLSTRLLTFVLSDVPDNTWIQLTLTTQDKCSGLSHFITLRSTGQGSNFVPDLSGRVYDFVRNAGDLEIRVHPTQHSAITCDIEIKYTAAVVLDTSDNWSNGLRTIDYWKEFYVVSHSEYKLRDYFSQCPISVCPPGIGHDVSVSILNYNPCSRVRVTLLDYKLDDDKVQLAVLVGGNSEGVLNSESVGSPRIFTNYYGEVVELQLSYDGRTLDSNEGFLLKYEVLDEGCALKPDEALAVRELSLTTHSDGNCSYSYQCSPPALSRLEQLLSMSCSGSNWVGLAQCNHSISESTNGQGKESGLDSSLTVGIAAGIPLLILLIVAVLLAGFYLHKKHTKHPREIHQMAASTRRYYNSERVSSAVPTQEDSPIYQNFGATRPTTAEEPLSEVVTEDHTYHNDLPSAARSDHNRKFRDIGEEYTTVQISTKPSRAPGLPPPQASHQPNPRVQLIDNDLYGT